MNITYRKATISDIDALIRLRLDFLTENRGGLSKEETKAIVSQLKDYYPRQLNNSFFAYLAEHEGRAISAVYMVLVERPANPDFITGRTATVLNVFTYPEYRRKGIATKLLDMMIGDARTMNISYLELSATEYGKPLYEKLGFEVRQPKYTEMRLNLL